VIFHFFSAQVYMYVFNRSDKFWLCEYYKMGGSFLLCTSVHVYILRPDCLNHACDTESSRCIKCSGSWWPFLKLFMCEGNQPSLLLESSFFPYLIAIFHLHSCTGVRVFLAGVQNIDCLNITKWSTCVHLAFRVFAPPPCMRYWVFLYQDFSFMIALP
jgi:hypothetical protein